MFFADGQSGAPDVINATADAVGRIPWSVVVILALMIVVGVVLLVSRIRANEQRTRPPGRPGPKPDRSDGRPR